jgi:type IV secretory pathway TrbD component
MAKPVPFAPPIDQMQLGNIRATWPVEAAPIKAAGSVANWLLGKGRSLVVDGGRAVAAQTAYQARYWCAPSALHGSLCWVLSLSARDTTNAKRSFTALISSVPPTYSGSYSLGANPTTIYIPVPNDGEGEYGLTLTTDATSANDRLWIHEIHLIEAPLTELTVATEEGKPVVGCELAQPRSQIYDGYDPYKSITGVMHAHQDLAVDHHHRGALFSWSSNYLLQQRNTTTFASLFFGLRPALQTRYMYGFGTGRITSRFAKASVLAHQSGGSTGQIRLTMSKGGVGVFSFPASAGPTWTHQNLNIATDDYTRWESDAGRRDGTDDLMLVEARVVSTGQISLYSICVSDVPGA